MDNKITFKQFTVACVYLKHKIYAIKLYRDLGGKNPPSLSQAKLFIEKEIPNKEKAEQIIDLYIKQQKEESESADLQFQNLSW